MQILLRIQGVGKIQNHHLVGVGKGLNVDEFKMFDRRNVHREFTFLGHANGRRIPSQMQHIVGLSAVDAIHRKKVYPAAFIMRPTNGQGFFALNGFQTFFHVLVTGLVGC